MSEFQRLDHELLQGYMDNLGKDIVQEMLDLYRQQSVIYLDEIKEAANGDSFEIWHTRCHKMKGAAGSVGLVEVHAKLVVIEKLELSVEEKLEQVSELTSLNNLAVDELNKWLES